MAPYPIQAGMQTSWMPAVCIIEQPQAPTGLAYLQAGKHHTGQHLESLGVKRPFLAALGVSAGSSAGTLWPMGLAAPRKRAGLAATGCLRTAHRPQHHAQAASFVSRSQLIKSLLSQKQANRR